MTVAGTASVDSIPIDPSLQEMHDSESSAMEFSRAGIPGTEIRLDRIDRVVAGSLDFAEEIGGLDAAVVRRQASGDRVPDPAEATVMRGSTGGCRQFVLVIS